MVRWGFRKDIRYAVLQSPACPVHSIRSPAYGRTATMGGGGGGGRPGEKGAGGIREVGKDVAGSGRKREKLRNIAQYFAIEKMQKAEAKK